MKMKLCNYLIELESVIGEEMETITVDRHGIFSSYSKTPEWYGSFVLTVNESKNIDVNYQENYNKLDLKKDIEQLELKELCTLLTYHVRKDRFVEGSLYKSMVEGKIYRIVKQICIYNDSKE